MSGAPGIPQNFAVQTGNQQNLVSWSLSTGATSYLIQRSLDNVTFTDLVTLSGSPLATSYVDSAVTLGTQYWYQTKAINSSGSSSYTTAQSAIPAQSGEMSLAEIRLSAKQRADRVNSNFVTDPEWNKYINQAMYELYDLLITVYEDYFIASPVQFVCDGSTFLYPLPNGTNTFLNALNTAQTVTPPAIYKLEGVDLALNNATNAYVTINKFNFIDRNRFIYPNTASTIYGVFNMQYRWMGNNLELIPTPTAGQSIRLWYIPRLTQLLQDTDTTVVGISGWVEYVIVKAAYYALTKEESDTTQLVTQLVALTDRINSSASNRDVGQPDKISDTRSGNSNGFGTGGFGSGSNGGSAGWAMLAIPSFAQNNITDGLLINSKLLSYSSLGNTALLIAAAYLFCLSLGYFRRRIFFANMASLFGRSLSTFRNHILYVVFGGSYKKMIRINAPAVVASMTNKHSFWDNSPEQLVGYASSREPASTYGEPRASVTAPQASSPVPTGVFSWIHYFAKETVCRAASHNDNGNT